MESTDDSQSSEMENYTNDNNHYRNSMEGCSSTIEDAPEIKEGAKEMSSGTSRKVNFQSIPCVPEVAVQEKIIICFENSEEKGLGYNFSDLDQSIKVPTTYNIRNEALRMVMTNKLALAKDTEFAIASIEPGKFKLLSPFTSNLNKLSNSLDYKCTFSEESDDFDITSIFNNVLKLIDIPEHANVTITSKVHPNCIIRIIFVYSSNFLIPQVNRKDPSYLKFVRSPYCFLDVFYLHEKQSDFNNVDRIYQGFGKIVSPSSYLLESSRDVAKVFNNAMKFLSHPNQRVVDTMWNF